MSIALYTSNFSNIHDAAAASTSQQRTLVIDESYTISSTLTLRWHTLSIPGAMLTYTGAGDALIVGDTTNRSFRLDVRLPEIKRSARAWSAGNIGTDGGVRLLNLNQCTVRLAGAFDFSKGVVCDGRVAWQNNDVQIGTVQNCAIGLETVDAGTGWVSQSQIAALKIQIDHALGSDIEGTRALNILTYENGLRMSANLEGAWQYMLWCACHWGRFDCRWEGDPARAHFTAAAHSNVLTGVSVDRLTVSRDSEDAQNCREWQDGPVRMTEAL